MSGGGARAIAGQAGGLCSNPACGPGAVGVLLSVQQSQSASGVRASVSGGFSPFSAFSRSPLVIFQSFICLFEVGVAAMRVPARSALGQREWELGRPGAGSFGQGTVRGILIEQKVRGK